MRVLITGKNSFVGNYVGPYLEDKSYQVVYISLRDDSWMSHDFSIYDALIHVAGIAHVSYQKKNKELYDEVNHQLTRNVAEKAKKEGVKHFIFLSSMIVYSPKEKKVDENTPLLPKGPYALSKLNAENALKSLEDNAFKVALLRPSVIYGPGNKGNIPKLIHGMKKARIFPKYKNLRSFLNIGNLAQAIYHLIKNKSYGTYHLADQNPLATYEFMMMVAEEKNLRVCWVSLFNPILNLLMPFSKTFQKIFGDFYYDSSLVKHDFMDDFVSTKEAIKTYMKFFESELRN
jgi:UDP-glucose 4-epimerase